MPKEILNICKENHSTSYLVHWFQIDSDEATWVNSEWLKLNFVEFITDLEDKVDSKEGSSVKDKYGG